MYKYRYQFSSKIIQKDKLYIIRSEMYCAVTGRGINPKKNVLLTFSDTMDRGDEITNAFDREE